jgi:hypothetical protein
MTLMQKRSTIMSTFSLTRVFCEWLLYPANTILRHGEANASLHHQKELSLKLVTFMQRILARRWRWEESIVLLS